ncbi:MAG TPA: M48 family metallopeptidase [Opitutaceae bacterium]|jgi:Zn-dependent protease with chaperone function
MDFFAAEQRAKKKTARLLILFGMAVAGTVAAGYIGAVILSGAVQARQSYGRSGYSYGGEPAADQPLFRPGLFAVVALGTLVVIGAASLYKWSEFSSGGAAVAEGVGGRKVDPHTTDPREHQLLNVVEEMAIASGAPVPSVYILDDEPAINSFAAGLTSSDAVITVTRGALEKLSRDEMQGVVAHEFSHILNGDMRMNIRVSAIIFGILVLGLAGRATLWSLRYGRFGSSRDRNGGGAMLLVVGVGAALLVAGYVGYFFGRLIQASVSRQREFLADASAVQFTRNPEGVTGALKKIGGYAIGSTLSTHKAAEISHFFFAQEFVSNFGGLWATHPPLGTRIRAIEPAFDGKYFEPKEVVDVAKEPWGRVPGMPPTPPPPSPMAGVALGAALAAAAGTITANGIAGAQAILAGVPADIRAAARSPHDAPILVLGLLLDDEPTVRSSQLQSIGSAEGSDALSTLSRLDAGLRALGPEHRLPVLQLALPALKAVPPTALRTFAGALDELVKADGRVSTFEFALQKLVLRALALSRAPASASTEIYSFQAVAGEISVVLSALAHASSDNDEAASRAFAEGSSQLKLLEGKLAYLPQAQCTMDKLDAALDRLAGASGPIKQRLLVAGGHVVSADGVLLTSEAELMRAVAASLDVPLPPLAAAA